MSWIENIRQKPHEQKVRIIWTVSLIVLVLLVILWVFTSRIGKRNNMDTSVFQTIGRGIHDVGEQYKNK